MSDMTPEQQQAFLAQMEAESAAAFKAAVDEWRQEKAEGRGEAVVKETGGAFGRPADGWSEMRELVDGIVDTVAAREAAAPTSMGGASLGPHPAARQLAAYNAAVGEGKAAKFLAVFTKDVALYDLQSGERKLDGVAFGARYRCVFEHSPTLVATVSQRLLVRKRPEPGARDPTFAVDFEQYSGLVAPTCGALDGSTGVAAEAAAADIVVVYRCVSGGHIDALWVAADEEGVGRAASASGGGEGGGTQALVEASAVYARALELIKQQLAVTDEEELRVAYIEF